MDIPLSSRVILLPDALCCDAGGEAVIFSESTGQYYGLNEVGQRIWRAFEQDSSLTKAFEAVLAEYDADPVELERDVQAFVRELASLKLISVQPEQ
jgi:hypothetical protein